MMEIQMSRAWDREKQWVRPMTFCTPLGCCEPQSYRETGGELGHLPDSYVKITVVNMYPERFPCGVFGIVTKGISTLLVSVNDLAW